MSKKIIDFILYNFNAINVTFSLFERIIEIFDRKINFLLGSYEKLTLKSNVKVWLNQSKAKDLLVSLIKNDVSDKLIINHNMI